jgi:hypothetical protein
VSLTNSGPANTANSVYFAFTTDAGEPNRTTWDAGTYTVTLNVTSQQGQALDYEVQLLRVDSTCGASTVLATSGEQTGTGIKTFTLSGVAASTGAASDRLQVRVLVDTGGGSATARQLQISVNTADSTVVTPW